MQLLRADPRWNCPVVQNEISVIHVYAFSSIPDTTTDRSVIYLFIYLNI